MRKEVLDALQQSIKHWEENYSDPINCSIEGEDCALCNLFFDEPGPRCVHPTLGKCPIYEKTGKTHCVDSPYYVVADIFYEIYDSCNDTIDPDHYMYPDLCLEIETELNYLKELLPDEKSIRN